MTTNSNDTTLAFQKNVYDKYIIYNSLFAALPYSGVVGVGALLPIFIQNCEEGFKNNKTPIEIVDHFFKQHTDVKNEKIKLEHLFKYVQYIERQVVLFDAIEDAAFIHVNDVNGLGSLTALIKGAKLMEQTEMLKNKFEKFKVRIVLTAHPTQFYPANVLGIIHDMGQAIEKNDSNSINQYIQQLGLTPFFNKKQPTPTNEAITLMWYLENIFYTSIGNIYSQIVRGVFENKYEGDNSFIELGFWPGGDRDGNPFVNAKTTLTVAKALRSSIIVCYYRDVRKLKRKLTFSSVSILLDELEAKLYENVFRADEANPISKKEIMDHLMKIKKMVIEDNYSLYLTKLESLIHKVQLFGTHFASLDIRQDSRVHHNVLMDIHQTLLNQNGKGILPPHYEDLSIKEQMSVLSLLKGELDASQFNEKLTKETIESIYAMLIIQNRNGAKGCHRYIISNCKNALQVMELYALCRLCGFNPLTCELDIVPLFENIEDLTNAGLIMSALYNEPVYNAHLKHRHSEQTIMLGFSDGTKDGGYLQANWSIYKAKETLSQVSRAHNIVVKFFDGRGGPPSRGGGKTHKFYASLDKEIENEEIQVTVQGQTITSNFGTIQSAQYNMEQLLSAGISNEIFGASKIQMTENNRNTLAELGHLSYLSYQNLKQHPQFLAYLQKFSPLNYYGKSNIASRPTQRGAHEEIHFSELRAIPFVGSWSQLKQNVPGYFGVGSALKIFKENGKWGDVEYLYNKIAFFKTLIDNSMMSMVKSNFEITKYIESDEVFSPLYKIIKDEFNLTKQMYLALNKNNKLMHDDVLAKNSIDIRDRIVLPLLTIQQYALCKLQDPLTGMELRASVEKLVTRTMFGVINAARNSA